MLKVFCGWFYFEEEANQQCEKTPSLLACLGKQIAIGFYIYSRLAKSVANAAITQLISTVIRKLLSVVKMPPASAGLLSEENDSDNPIANIFYGNP